MTVVVLVAMPEEAAGEGDVSTREDMLLACFIVLTMVVETRGAD